MKPTSAARRSAGLLAAIAVLSLSAAARADGPQAAWAVPDRPAHPAASPSPLSASPAFAVSAGLGFARSYGSSFGGGFGPELSVGGRASLFELGARGDYLTSLSGSRFGLGGYGGVGWHANDVNLSLQGELGVHDYRHVGSGFMTDDPGIGGDVGYAGARASFDLRLRGSRHVRPLLGAAITLRHDLVQQHQTYTYQETPWLDLTGTSKPHAENGEADLGASAELSLMLRAGVEFE